MRQKKCCDFKAFLFLFFSAPVIILVSCGIEEYPYIDPVPQGNITTELNDRATVRIPGGYDDAPFSHFMIFYRIYVSDRDEGSPSTANFYTINSVLADDYNAISRYIGSETEVNVNMDSLFGGRKYRHLVLSGSDINSFLSYGASGKDLIFDFSFGSLKAPTMTLADRGTENGATVTLLRSNDNGAFNPLPADRYFINREDLWKSENINDNINADVVNKSNFLDPLRTTYVAMFIVAVGVFGYTTVYSTPAFIHVFQLPDQW